MIREIIGIAAVLFILSAVTVITKLCSKKLSHEASRKIIHITMGMTAVSLPFIFQEKLSVIILGVIAILGLVILRLNKSLKNGIGTALLGIERQSYGEFYFVTSIVLIFTLHTNIVTYLIPMLVLTFADSAAALVGVNYGRHNLAHELEDKKSSEGTVMFFIVAFICTLVPLQLMTDVGRLEVLLISFLIGVLSALIEAVSNKGNDNFLLPLLVYSFVGYNIDKPSHDLLISFFTMLAFLVVVILVYKLINISKLSAAYAMLVAYVIIIQGGLLWTVAPLMLYITFGILPMANEREKKLVLTYKAVESNTVIGVACLWVATIFTPWKDILFLAFSLVFAYLLLLNTNNRYINFLTRNKKIAMTAGLLKAFGFVAIPSFVLKHLFFNGITTFEIALFSLMLLCFSFVASWLNKKVDYTVVSNKTALANEISSTVLIITFLVFNYLGGLIL